MGTSEATIKKANSESIKNSILPGNCAAVSFTGGVYTNTAAKDGFTVVAGTAGSIKVDGADSGTAISYYVPAGGVLGGGLRVSKVYEANTNATAMVAQW